MLFAQPLLIQRQNVELMKVIFCFPAYLPPLSLPTHMRLLLMLLSDEYLIMRKGWQGGSPPQGGEITEDWWQCLLPVICANVFHLFFESRKLFMACERRKAPSGTGANVLEVQKLLKTFGDEVKDAAGELSVWCGNLINGNIILSEAYLPSARF